MKSSSLRLILLTLAFSLQPSAFPSTRIEANLVFTNLPAEHQTLQVNGVTRTWTNLVTSASTEIKSTNTIAWARTNLLTHLAGYPMAGTAARYGATPTNLLLLAPMNSNLTVVATGWGVVSYTTYQISDATTVVVPITAITNITARTNIGSGLVEALDYATNQLPPTISAVAGLVSRTNGYGTNTVLQSPHFTNAVNHGNALSSPGTGTSSQQFGQGSIATNTLDLAVGNSAIAGGSYSTAIGAQAYALHEGDIALGNEAIAEGGRSIAIGAGAGASGTNTLAIGASATATHANSFAIGRAVATTRTNEIRLGGSQDVVIGGVLYSEKGATNLALSGITTNSGAITGGGITNVSMAASAVTATNLQAHGGNLTNVAVAASGVTATNLQAHGGNLTNVALAASGITATNLQALGGGDTNRTYDRGFGTNLTLSGANTLAAGANLAIPATALTSIADGHNVLDCGSNAYVRLTGSPATAWQLGGLLGDVRSGRTVILENQTGYQMLVLHESGTTPTAGQRISCTTSFTVASGGVVTFAYDATASRWKVLSARATSTEVGVGYGALMMNATNLVVCTGASEVYTNILGYTTPATNWFYGAPALGALTNLYAGWYRVTFACSFLGANSTTYEFDVATNGVTVDTISTKERTDVAARHRSTTSSGILYLPAGCRTELKVQDYGGATSVAIHRASIVIGTP